MQNGKNKTKLKLIYDCVAVLVSAVLLFISSFVAFGWFSQSNGISANNSDVQVQSAPSIMIENKEDNSVDNTTTKLIVDMVTEEKIIAPGSFGEVNMRLTSSEDCTVSISDELIMWQVISGVGSKYIPDPNLNANESQALVFAQTHIGCFREKTENAGVTTYSGWMGEGCEYTLTGGERLSVTVYWTWIATYGMIIGGTYSETNIAAEDVIVIGNSVVADPSKWLSSRGNLLTEVPESVDTCSLYYNYADVDIGLYFNVNEENPYKLVFEFTYTVV